MHFCVLNLYTGKRNLFNTNGKRAVVSKQTESRAAILSRHKNGIPGNVFLLEHVLRSRFSTTNKFEPSVFIKMGSEIKRNLVKGLLNFLKY